MIVLKWLPANHGHPVNQARPKLDQSFQKSIVDAYGPGRVVGQSGQ